MSPIRSTTPQPIATPTLPLGRVWVSAPILAGEPQADAELPVAQPEGEVVLAAASEATTLTPSHGDNSFASSRRLLQKNPYWRLSAGALHFRM